MPGLADGVGRSPRLRRFAALRARSAEWGWEVMGTTADFSLHYPVPDMLGALSARAELAVGGEWSGWPAQVALIAARPPSPRVRLGLPAPRATFLLAIIDGGPMSCQFVAEAVRGGIDVVMLSRGSLPEAARRRLHAVVGSGALRPGDHVAVGEVQMLTARRLRHAGGSLDPTRQLDLLVDLIEDLADLG